MKFNLTNLILIALSLAIAYLALFKDSNKIDPTTNLNPSLENFKSDKDSNRIREINKQLKQQSMLIEEIKNDFRTQVSQLKLEVERLQDQIDSQDDVIVGTSPPSKGDDLSNHVYNDMREKVDKIEAALGLKGIKAKQMSRIGDRLVREATDLYRENKGLTFQRKLRHILVKIDRDVKSVLSPSEYRKYQTLVRGMRK